MTKQPPSLFSARVDTDDTTYAVGLSLQPSSLHLVMSPQPGPLRRAAADTATRGDQAAKTNPTAGGDQAATTDPAPPPETFKPPKPTQPPEKFKPQQLTPPPEEFISHQCASNGPSLAHQSAGANDDLQNDDYDYD